MWNPSHSYGTSPVIWDHTVLPATRHKWTRPALIGQRAILGILGASPLDPFKSELALWQISPFSKTQVYIANSQHAECVSERILKIGLYIIMTNLVAYFFDLRCKCPLIDCLIDWSIDRSMFQRRSSLCVRSSSSICSALRSWPTRLVSLHCSRVSSPSSARQSPASFRAIETVSFAVHVCAHIYYKTLNVV